MQPVLWAVVFNGLPGEVGVLFLQDGTGHVFAAIDFLTRWNMRLPPQTTAPGQDPHYVDLRLIPGLSYQVDARNAAISITADGEAFMPNPRDGGQGASATPVPYTPGGFLNYDLSATHAGNDASAQALISAGVFAGEGLLTHSFVLQNATPTRLFTTYQTDYFAHMKTLRIGDMVNTPGAWGRGVLFGGVQYGTNLALRPDFLAQSAPALSGTALLPSTVDVYVNNALRNQQNVEAGPFTIHNLSVVQGSGEVALVVKDVLGREQVITQQFLSTPTLLREGLVQASFEAGALRQNMGLASNDYGKPFAATTYRKGLLPRTTAEARGELQPGGATAGASVATLLPQISSVLEATLAASSGHGLADTGALASLGYSLVGQAMALNARLSAQTDSFRQIGSDANNLQRNLLSLQWVSPWAGGNLSANYVHRRTQADSTVSGQPGLWQAAEQPCSGQRRATTHPD